MGSASPPPHLNPRVRARWYTRTIREESGHDFYTSTVVHELARFCGPEIKSADRIADHSYRHRPDSFQLTPSRAIRTADCYSEFAGEARLGREPPQN